MSEKSAKKKVEKTTNKNTANAPSNKMSFFGLFLLLFALALLISFVSYFLHGQEDQSTLTAFSDRSQLPKNALGKLGAHLAEFFIFKGFGIAAFLIIRILFSLGVQPFRSEAKKKTRNQIKKMVFWNLYLMITLSFIFSFFNTKNGVLGGMIGFEINSFFTDYIGKVGTFLLFVLLLSFYFIFRLNISVQTIQAFGNKWSTYFNAKLQKQTNPETEAEKPIVNVEETEPQPQITNPTPTPIVSETIAEKPITKPVVENISIPKTNATDPDIEVIVNKEEALNESEITAKQLVTDFGEFDPTLELSNFRLPSSELLNEHANSDVVIDKSELEENKNRIVETLRNYKIEITNIKVTVGPTVTLYEIVPEAGVRISKIKNLEDDIALSLSALGIRIIAPIPGKGTVGIEVPNNKPSVVSMKSAIQSPKFQSAAMELPIALGRNIQNETYVFDLAKMPHLLMAGATGQGKSVGLNAILTSLLYKKHPAEVKFVLVDPKKVELTLFNKIERHYLAKLPNTEDAIITDNTKVIHTLNSLCIEMDNRYSLLKDAMVRNIKEYNEKFKQRKLNPEQGHRFLPYIVLVVDEFADLIMTAGKEVETPIARLAQLARAIGIHLIIATQRPSVNVITGIIKANFPARIAFRVTSKIDSRTILDGPGADQLVGRGDLLFTQGNDMVRVQCAFVDTPEVERICEYIGSQKAYPDAYLLPEYVGEDGDGTKLDIDISDRDVLFREAAEIIVTAQQGSASLLQRKLKLGYNRAGRLIDQLEAAGIVGPFEGSKARSVNITDLVSLDQFFENEKK
ncbi:DNA translocase FtsK [Flavobacterium agricola]|uniref:DNA translocase FtsK n=1 Tax=Flavobacterium agricola TaxID=2870839 RepID=A0ABY6M108_9FLAO|nr:DNA translocase FtsK [Flavobacterium agricola]UYW02242.1 DNA translocase FtsK [Flavobacterium agricola]